MGVSSATSPTAAGPPASSWVRYLVGAALITSELFLTPVHLPNFLRTVCPLLSRAAGSPGPPGALLLLFLAILAILTILTTLLC